jgi:fluoride exporter
MPDPRTAPEQPIAPDLNVRVPARRRELTMARLAVLAVIAAGGVAGALARYGLGLAFPHAPAAFPWATFGINTSGCLLIGFLMVCSDQFHTHRLVRPFVGVGLLGGFTTFSTHIVEAQQAVDAGAARLAVAYLAGTLLAALAAVWAGSALTLALIRTGRRRKER